MVSVSQEFIKGSVRWSGSGSVTRLYSVTELVQCEVGPAGGWLGISLYLVLWLLSVASLHGLVWASLQHGCLGAV